MEKCPEGYWICPKCGDYVEDAYHCCPNCKYDKNKGVSEDKKNYEAYKTYKSSISQSSAGESKPAQKIISDVYNIGNIIQGIAKVLLVLSIIGVLILSVILGRGKYGDFQFGIFLLYLISGGVISTIEYLILAAIGTLVEDVGNIRADIRAIREKKENEDN